MQSCCFATINLLLFVILLLPLLLLKLPILHSFDFEAVTRGLVDISNNQLKCADVLASVYNHNLLK